MSPLREALSRLSSVGLVMAEGQRGFSVARIRLADVTGLTKSRAWVEVFALRFAMATGDRNWEAEILAAAHRLSGRMIYFEANGKLVLNEVWPVTHQAIHATLVSAPISAHIRRFLSGLDPSERDIAGEHQALAEASLARDVARASDVMVKHLVTTTRLILEGDPEYAPRAERLIARLMDEIAADMDGHGSASPDARLHYSGTSCRG